MGYSYSNICRNIIWRLKEYGKDPFYTRHLRKAIMIEAGLDERTIKKYKNVLKEMDLIKSLGGHVYTFGEESII